jgi:hypothetical protein
MELINILTPISYAVDKIKAHFDVIFLRPLSTSPNIIAICKETRKNKL